MFYVTCVGYGLLLFCDVFLCFCPDDCQAEALPRVHLLAGHRLRRLQGQGHVSHHRFGPASQQVPGGL